MNYKKDQNVASDFQKRAKEYEYNSKWVTDKDVNNIPLNYLLTMKTGGDLLDAGGGTGYLSQYLSNHLKFNSITLVDISEDMLKEAENKNYIIKAINSSIEKYCETTINRFDVILIRQVLHYVEDVNLVFSLLKSLLKDNGVIYVGQFLETDIESRDWHNELIRNISKNRRRTILYEECLEYVRLNRLEVIQSDVTDFEENLSDFYKRRINEHLSFDKLRNKMINSINQNIRERMLIKITSDNIYFRVKFHHFLLRKKVK